MTVQLESEPFTSFSLELVDGYSRVQSFHNPSTKQPDFLNRWSGVRLSPGPPSNPFCWHNLGLCAWVRQVNSLHVCCKFLHFMDGTGQVGGTGLKAVALAHHCPLEKVHLGSFRIASCPVRMLRTCSRRDGKFRHRVRLVISLGATRGERNSHGTGPAERNRSN